MIIRGDIELLKQELQLISILQSIFLLIDCQYI